MIKLHVKTDGFIELKQKLLLAPRQIEVATQRALLHTATKIKDNEIAEMTRVFDRPTRWTLGAMRVKVTGKMEVTAGIVDPEGAFKRAASYLDVQATGGQRKVKAFEKALQSRGLMPVGWFAVPGEGAKFDSYGNMSTGQLRQILSYFDAAESSAGSIQNMGYAGREKKRKGTRRAYGFEYLIVMPGKQRNLKQPGIYQRFFTGFGSSIKPVLIYIKTAAYRKRFDFERIANTTYDQNIESEIKTALNIEYMK